MTRLRRDEHGTVVIEFALISTVLMLFLAGVIDLIFLVSAGRDLERTSAQIAAVLTVGCDDSACANTRMVLYNERKANALVLYRTATVRMVNIARKNDTISVCGGVTTFIENDTRDMALGVMSNGQSAVAVTLEYSYVPFLPFVVRAAAQLRRNTVAVWKTSGAAC